jgi:signal transduction histidine kinase
MRRLKLSLRHKFFLSIVFIIVPILGIIFAWAGVRSERNTTSQIINQARILARQIVMTRQWVSDCGGIMVNRDSDGAKETLYFLDDRLDTQRGTFSRFTPAMVTKKLSQYSLRENLYHFRLASLNPMNPDNAPDAFEKMALIRFVNKGAKEVYIFDKDGDQPVFRYSLPLYVDQACMECHKNFSTGTVAGCLSIFFPSEQIKHALQNTHLKLAGAGTGLILLTIMTLFFLLRHVVIRPVNDLKGMATEISNGNLQARVHLETGDEFESLGLAFNRMGQRLAKSREIMEDKIAQATRELSDANRELQQLDELKTDFIADMSHELRSPVTAIKGGLDYLKRTIHEEGNKTYLALIDNNLLRLTHLVSDMLDLTRIEAGKVNWHFEENDLSVLIREVIEILSFKAGEKSIALCYPGSTPVWVEMDLERIEQVLVNLIENAIKFSSPGTRVEIDTRVESSWVKVTVKDFGIGIAEKDLETIFQKFHTLPSGGGNGQTKGTGLGLTICRKIVEAHGGRIWAQSTAGRGSTFCFLLPPKYPPGGQRG